jgi:hypothetical protein
VNELAAGGGELHPKPSIATGTDSVKTDRKTGCLIDSSNQPTCDVIVHAPSASDDPIANAWPI